MKLSIADIGAQAPVIHPTAEVSPRASIGSGTRIWHQAQVREGARVGSNCVLSKGVYVDFDVQIGDNTKIQNGCFIYHGATLEEGVFLGPGVILTNDKVPRAINLDGSLKTDSDWELGEIVLRRGCSLGAGVIVLPGVKVGEFSMVGSGAVVTRDVPDFGLVLGNPARLVGFVCACGLRITGVEPKGDEVVSVCRRCGTDTLLPSLLWEGVA